jgi:hypothetical protein
MVSIFYIPANAQTVSNISIEKDNLDTIKINDKGIIKLFGISDNYKVFINKFYLKDSYSFEKLNIPRNIKSQDERNIKFFLRLNYNNKPIVKNHNDFYQDLTEILQNSNSSIEYCPNKEAILQCDGININEYILENGYAQVDESDFKYNKVLIKKYNSIQSDAKKIIVEFGALRFPLPVSKMSSLIIQKNLFRILLFVH